MTDAAPLSSDRKARAMFWLAFAHLLALAGLFHRATKPDVHDFELVVLLGWLLGWWPVFIVDAVHGYLRRDRSLPKRRALRRAALVALFPPARMGTPDPRSGLVWLPRRGWVPRARKTLNALDAAFSGPMLVFALLILPVLAAEYYAGERVNAFWWFSFALNAALAAIWVAFATEFILKVSVAPHPGRFVREKWVDLLIVLLPAFEFALSYWASSAGLARLLRVTQVSDQVAKYGRVYRMRGVVARGWQAMLAVEALSKILGESRESRLRKLDEQIAVVEELLAELRAKADALRAAESAAPSGPGGG